MDIGRRIASARMDAGYGGQEEFADALGVSVWTVRAWERKAKPTRPSNENMDAIVKLTRKPRSYFFGEEESTVARLKETLEQVQREVERMQREGAEQHHPGLDALQADAELRALHRVTDEELDLARQLGLPGGIRTKELALAAVAIVRLARRDQ